MCSTLYSCLSIVYPFFPYFNLENKTIKIIRAVNYKYTYMDIIYIFFIIYLPQT